MSRWDTDRASGAVPTQRSQPGTPLAGRLSDVGSVWLDVVQGKEAGHLWNEYVDRYHYLGYDGKPDLLVGDFVPGQPGVPRGYHGWVWVYLRKSPQLSLSR